MLSTSLRASSLAALALLALACAPRARPLPGTPVVARLPAAQLPLERQRLDFRWEFVDGDVSARGDGVARLAGPDSARVDFFLDGGYGGGWAVLIGDRLTTPNGAGAVKRYLPPTPLLWATLGRLAVPAAADTVARRDGDVLRADIGRDPLWRVTFTGDRLAGLARISGGRIAERVERASDGSASYRNDAAHRSLVLRVTRSQGGVAFDDQIWRP
jgi:hypothetical protein